jgi:hypothetical protein
MSLSHIDAVINYTREKDTIPSGMIKLDVHDYASSSYAQDPTLIDPRQVPIYNARQAGKTFSLDRNGFALYKSPTAVTNFNDPDQIEQIYLTEIKTFLRDTIGADEALLFGHVVRTDDPNFLKAQRETDVRFDKTRSGGAALAHIDFTGESVAAFVTDFVGEEEAKRLLKKRFMNLNLWRGIRKVERLPLAVCDASTASMDELILLEISNPVGVSKAHKYGHNISYRPAHRWYYYPQMEPDEILAFKIYDSKDSSARRTPHSAFVDPTSSPDAPPRQSIEVRAIVFFPD